MRWLGWGFYVLAVILAIFILCTSCDGSYHGSPAAPDTTKADTCRDDTWDKQLGFGPEDFRQSVLAFGTRDPKRRG